MTNWSLNVVHSCFATMMNLSNPQRQLQLLSNEELEKLDVFLNSDATPEECLFPIEMLDGYMTALAVGPDEIEPDIWISYIWDQENNNKPSFSSAVEEKTIRELLDRHMNAIVLQFKKNPDDFVPLYEQFMYRDEEERKFAVENWALGFAVGIELAHASWSPFLAEEETAQLVLPIFLLAKLTDDFDDLSEEEISDLTRLMPEVVVEIYYYWWLHQ